MNRMTRYLCAAGETNRHFRTQVMKQISSTYRFLTPCLGVDMHLVVQHCLRANKRDLLLESLLSFIVMCTIILACSEKMFIGLLLSQACLLAVVAVFVVKLIEYRIVSREVIHSHTHTEFANRMNQWKWQTGNLIYYGGFSPFAGSGHRLSGWSFLIHTDGGTLQSGEDQGRVDIDLPEMYAYMGNKIKSLQMENVSIRDMLFVDGKALDKDHPFLQQRDRNPNVVVDHTTMREYQQQNQAYARSYKAIQVMGWQGDFVLSTYVRLVKNKGSLFVEVENYVLLPLEEKYYAIDQLSPRISIGLLIQLLCQAIVSTIVTLPLSPWRVLHKGIESVFPTYTHRNHIFQHGAEKSIREMVAANSFRNAFQKSDCEMVHKQIERTLMDGIVAFLHRSGMDTSALKAKQETIINNGIMVNDGVFKADHVAVQGHSKQIVTGMARLLTKSSRVRR